MTRKLLWAAALAWFGTLPAAHAQAELIEISKSRDWTVYKSVSGEQECGVISKPRKTVNTREGRIVEVIRGDILLAVTILPKGRHRQLVSFQGGYPFKKDSTVELEIGSRRFVLTPGTSSDNSEWAWPEEGKDGDVIEALKKGRDAVVTGISRRDTKTEDTFSLMGLTDALTLAENCAAQI